MSSISISISSASHLSRAQTVEKAIVKALDIIRNNSLAVLCPALFTKELDLDALARDSRVHAQEELARSSGPVEQVAVAVLKFMAARVKEIDGHTFFSPKTSTSTVQSSSSLTPQPLPCAEVSSDGIAVIELPFCILEDGTDYVAAGLKELAECVKKAPKAWVIDLRLNDGGNMWPMLDVVAPLLETTTPGAFLFHRPSRSTIKKHWQVEAPRHLEVPRGQPVIVWSSKITGSSGEMVSISFHGRPNTLFLGDRTAGVPTCNTDIPVGKFGSFFLTNGRCMDRNGELYFDPIQPDKKIRVPIPRDGELTRHPAYQERLAANSERMMAETRRWLKGRVS